jgi:hypothetical protein
MVMLFDSDLSLSESNPLTFVDVQTCVFVYWGLVTKHVFAGVAVEVCVLSCVSHL